MVYVKDELMKCAISGKVIDVGTSPAKLGRPSRITEHDPLLKEAVIQVHAVVSGELEATYVAVRFPGSDDVAWRGHPKLDMGDEGTWCLVEQDESPISPDLYPGLHDRVFVIET